MMKLKSLIGKTIKDISRRKSKKTDDVLLDIIFTDDSAITLEGVFGGYTGESNEEYPTGVNIHGKDYDYDEDY